MTTADRNICRMDLIFDDFAGILTVYDTKWRTDVPADVDGAHIVYKPNRAFATGNKVGAVRIAHPGQLNSRSFGVLLADTLKCLFAYEIHMTSSFIFGTTYITLKGGKVKGECSLFWKK